MYKQNEYPILTISSKLNDKAMNKLFKEAQELSISTIKLVLKSIDQDMIENINGLDAEAAESIYLKFTEASLYDKIKALTDYSLIYEATIDSRDFSYLSEFSQVSYLHMNLDVNSIEMKKLKSMLDFFDSYEHQEQYVVFNPFFSSQIDFPKYDEITNLIDESNTVYLENTHIDKLILTAHPCNAYACAHNTCHQKKSNYPRDISIDSKGYIYIYNIDSAIGNINNNGLEELLKLNEAPFVALCKQIYTEYIIDYPFKFFPLKEILIKEAGKGRYED